MPIISNVRKITINNNSNGIITINTSNYATIKGDTQIELGFKYTTISLVSSPINNMWIIALNITIYVCVYLFLNFIKKRKRSN